jgi:hypothetical protein
MMDGSIASVAAEEDIKSYKIHVSILPHQLFPLNPELTIEQGLFKIPRAHEEEAGAYKTSS